MLTVNQIKFTVLKSCYYISIKDTEVAKNHFRKSVDELYIDIKLLYDQFTQDEKKEFKLPTIRMNDDKQFKQQMINSCIELKELLTETNYEQVVEIYYYYNCYLLYCTKTVVTI